MEPWFGRGSYWAHSRPFAEEFRLWLIETFGGEHAIYAADVDLVDHLEAPFGVFLDSSRVTRRVDEFASAGNRWFSFHEAGAWKGSVLRQYVYLGTELIPAAPV